MPLEQGTSTTSPSKRPDRFSAGTKTAAKLALAGLCVGGVAAAFHYLVDWIFSQTIVRASECGTVGFLVWSFCSVVGASLIVSLLISRLDPSAGGGGVMPTKIAFWKNFGIVPMKTAVVKFFGSALTLGGGVSMGPEGPVVQIGAACASGLGGWLGVAKQERRVLCAGGAAAAIAAAFNAPLAAIFFILEEIIGDLNSRLISGILFASVMGALVSHALIGAQPSYQVAPLGDASWKGLLLCTIVAVVATTAGVLFQKGAMTLRKRTRAWQGPVPAWAKPVLGAVFSWAIGAAVFLACGRLGVFGIGYTDVTQAIAGNLCLGTAALLLGGKLLATTFAVGTGGCGGIFAPSFFIGAMSGAATVALASKMIAISPSDAAMIVMIGMCACLGAVIRAPLTCVLLIFETTHQFSVVPLALLATLISQFLAKFLHSEGMYEQMLRQDGQNPEHVLPPRDYKRWKELHVGTIAQYQVICANGVAPEELRRILAGCAFERFPVLDETGKVTGILTRKEAASTLATGNPPSLHAPVWVAASDTLEEAQKRIIDAKGDVLCVGNASSRTLEGLLTLHDFLRAQQRLSDDAET